MEGKYGRLRCADGETKWDDEEPLFLLRGQDRLAPMILRLYAQIAESHGRYDVYDGVMQQHDRMIRWQGEHQLRIKLPD